MLLSSGFGRSLKMVLDMISSGMQIFLEVLGSGSVIQRYSLEDPLGGGPSEH